MNTPSVDAVVFTDIVGIEHNIKSRGARVKLIGTLELGILLEIQREKKNRFDKNACAVHLKGKKIGYIPRKVAKDLAPRLDCGGKFVFFISDFSATISPAYEILSIKVTGVRLARSRSSRRDRPSLRKS